MHPIETHHQFVELRAQNQTFASISATLGVAVATLCRWEQEHAQEIARFRRIRWEEAENKVGVSLEDRLKRIVAWMVTAERELETRNLNLMNNRDLFRFLREARREYHRLRAVLMNAERACAKPAPSSRPPEPPSETEKNGIK